MSYDVIADTRRHSIDWEACPMWVCGANTPCVVRYSGGPGMSQYIGHMKASQANLQWFTGPHHACIVEKDLIAIWYEESLLRIVFSLLGYMK